MAAIALYTVGSLIHFLWLPEKFIMFLSKFSNKHQNSKTPQHPQKENYTLSTTAKLVLVL